MSVFFLVFETKWLYLCTSLATRTIYIAFFLLSSPLTSLENTRFWWKLNTFGTKLCKFVLRLEKLLKFYGIMFLSVFYSMNTFKNNFEQFTSDFGTPDGNDVGFLHFLRFCIFNTIWCAYNCATGINVSKNWTQYNWQHVNFSKTIKNLLSRH